MLVCTQQFSVLTPAQAKRDRDKSGRLLHITGKYFMIIAFNTYIFISFDIELYETRACYFSFLWFFLH